MNSGSVLAVTLVVVFILLYEWPKINRNQKKEKVVFICLTATGWLLAVLIIFFPDIPNPTQLVEKIFQPISKLIIRE